MVYCVHASKKRVFELLKAFYVRARRHDTPSGMKKKTRRTNSKCGQIMSPSMLI